MSTASRTRQRRNHVTPSLVKSETFLFAVLVIGLAIYVPYMFKTAGKGSSIRYANTTVPIGGVVPDAPIAVPSPVVVPPTPAVVPPPANVPVTQPLSTPTEQRPAPITYILPYLLFFGRSVLGLIKHLPFFVYRILHAAVLRPLYYPFAFILAVLRPITLLLEIIYAVFLRTPLAILSWFIREAIYPLYIFSGIAAIIGTMFGYSASHIPRTTVFITERIRTQIWQSQSDQPPLLASPTSVYSNGGIFNRKRGGFPFRSVTFDDDANDGNESDVTEVASRTTPRLRGVSART